MVGWVRYQGSSGVFQVLVLACSQRPACCSSYYVHITLLVDILTELVASVVIVSNRAAGKKCDPKRNMMQTSS